MPIQFNCICGKLFNVPDIHAGKNLKCKSCDAVVSIPKIPSENKQPVLSVKNNTANKLPQQPVNMPTQIPISEPIKKQEFKPNVYQEISTEQTKACPFCAEIIQSTDIKCKYCNEKLNADLDSSNSKNYQSKKMEPSLVVLLYIITLGFYNLFFLYRVFNELNKRNYKKISAVNAVLFHFIPFYNIYWVIVVWGEIAYFFEKEFKKRKLPPPGVGLIRNIPVLMFLTLITFGLASIITLPLQLIAVANIQKYLNQLQDFKGNKDSKQRRPRR